MPPRARLIVLLGAFFCLNGSLGWQAWCSARAEETKDEGYPYTLLFAQVVQLIRQDYVDENKVSYQALTYAALRGMLSSLDPHSQFLDEDAYQEMQRETTGQFSGLGIVVGEKAGAIIIMAPMEGTPGGRAGLRSGDRILRINGKTTDKMTLAQATDALKGKTGEKATLTLLRAGDKGAKSVFEVELTRETIQVSSVKNPHLLPPEMAGANKIGYVRIEEFAQNTSAELESALNQLEQSGMQALIIDLRNNPGGLLNAAVDVTGKFLPPHTVIVSTKGRTPDQSSDFRAQDEREHPHYPIAVLVNGYSASGAEIVAGALKDLSRAILVGETTFGKGSVQTVRSLGNGIGLRLTTAQYYTPSKRTIQEVGVTPDIVVPMNQALEQQLALQQSDRELTPEEKAELTGFRDPQLDRAVSSLESIQVYEQRQAELDPALKNSADMGTSPAPTPATER